MYKFVIISLFAYLWVCKTLMGSFSIAEIALHSRSNFSPKLKPIHRTNIGAFGKLHLATNF